jgi:hypothetical protein
MATLAVRSSLKTKLWPMLGKAWTSNCAPGFIDLPIGPFSAVRERMAEVEKDLLSEAVAVLTEEEKPGIYPVACV